MPGIRRRLGFDGDNRWRRKACSYPTGDEHVFEERL
jgi:hypothetical protein